MKTYFSIFKMRIIAGMQYRAAAWAGILCQFFFGIVYIMIYSAFYNSSGGIDTITLKQLINYLWLTQAFYALLQMWGQDNDLLGRIANGDVAYELTKPYKTYSFWFASLTAKRLASVLLRFLPVIIFSVLLPSPYGLTLPDSFLSFILFLISLTFSLFLVTAISMYVYILTFKTLSPSGSKMFFSVFCQFLMGAVLPIPLMPNILQKILNFFPFRYISDLPFRIYSGNISAASSLIQIIIQITWIILLIYIGKKLLDRVLKNVIIQGG